MGPTSAADRADDSLTITPYGYEIEPAAPSSWADWCPIELDAQGIPVGHVGAAIEDAHETGADFAVRLADETRRSFETGLERGRHEGRAAERDAQHAIHAGETARRAEQLTQILDRFTAQRDSYLERAEHEVVKLALAVSARILRREAQMDPLLLLGAVRVALGQLAASTQVRLRVPAGDTDLWTEAVALLPNRTLKPQVIGEETLQLADCMLETDLGTVDLGVRAQLNEIERGFFDRTASSIVSLGAAAEQA